MRWFDISPRRATSKGHTFITCTAPHQETPLRHPPSAFRGTHKSHYVRDTTWREDHHKAYTGNGPYSMAILRNIALGLLRLNGKYKIKEGTEEICRDRNRALHLLVT